MFGKFPSGKIKRTVIFAHFFLAASIETTKNAPKRDKSWLIVLRQQNATRNSIRCIFFSLARNESSRCCVASLSKDIVSMHAPYHANGTHVCFSAPPRSSLWNSRTRRSRASYCQAGRIPVAIGEHVRKRENRRGNRFQVVPQVYLSGSDSRTTWQAEHEPVTVARHFCDAPDTRDSP